MIQEPIIRNTPISFIDTIKNNSPILLPSQNKSYKSKTKSSIPFSLFSKPSNKNISNTFTASASTIATSTTNPSSSGFGIFRTFLIFFALFGLIFFLYNIYLEIKSGNIKLPLFVNNLLKQAGFIDISPINLEENERLNNAINMPMAQNINILPLPNDELATPKKGWCFVGEDRDFRSCISVSESDKCMSGNIFPTKDICINPSLRL